MKMIKTVKQKRLVLIGAFFLALCLSLISVVCIRGNADEKVEWESSNLSTAELSYGEELSLPERNLMVGETAVAAEVTLIYPDGTATTADKVLLDKGGIYTLRYVAVSNGKTYMAEEEFRIDENFATAGTESSIVYGEIPEESLVLSEPENALQVRLANGESLRFTQPVDLNSVTKDDVLIEVMAKPDVYDSCDFTSFTFTFTDVLDSSVYFSVYCYAYGGAINGNRAYTLAYGNGQQPKGYYGNTLNVNQSGASTGHCFAGAHDQWDVDKDGDTNEKVYDGLRVSYDAAEKQVYINTKYVIDFDDPVCYPEGVWEGFKSGRVNISVTAGDYASATANFNVYRVYGMDLSQEKYVDANAPVLTVESEYESMPNAEVGYSYPVPTATAFDEIDGYVSVDTQVYFNYNSNSPKWVSIENGAFLATDVGYYAIVYTATDYHGNSVSELVWVNSLGDAADPVVTVSQADLDNGEYTEGDVGERISVANAAFSGGSGKLSDICYVTFGNETLTVEDGKFLPLQAGTYTVWYEVTDTIGQVEKASYDVVVTLANAPVYTDEAVLPKVLIAGSEYVVPTYYAYDYANGGKAIVAECKVEDGNSSKTYKAGEIFTPVVNANGDKVKLTFIAGGNEKVYEIPAIVVWGKSETGRIQFAAQEYLYSADGSVTAEQTNSGLKATTSTENGSFTYANSLIEGAFALQLKGVEEETDFNGITVTLYDSVKEAETLQLSFTSLGGGKMQASIGGTLKTINFDFDSEDSLSIEYSDGAFVINAVEIAAGTFVNGKAFNGFSSGKVWFEVAFTGVEGQSSVYVEKISNHTFGQVRLDRTAPSIVLSTDAGGEVGLNVQTLIPAAMAGDALDPNVKFSLTVMDENENVVSDVNGLALEEVDPTVSYTVKFTKLGMYLVQYTAQDVFNSSANKTTYTFTYVATDLQAPTLSFKTDFKTTAKVGDTYVIPNYTVKDDLSAKENITVIKYFVGPNGRMQQLAEDSNSFVLSLAGEYEVHIMATDEAGNVSYASAYITVTEV